MSTEDDLEAIRIGIDDIAKQRDLLESAFPKIVSKVGAALCKIAETVLPAERVIIIKSNPSSGKCIVHLVGFKDPKMKDIIDHLNNCYIVTKKMENKDGVLEDNHKDAIN